MTDQGLSSPISRCPYFWVVRFPLSNTVSCRWVLPSLNFWVPEKVLFVPDKVEVICFGDAFYPCLCPKIIVVVGQKILYTRVLCIFFRSGRPLKSCVCRKTYSWNWPFQNYTTRSQNQIRLKIKLGSKPIPDPSITRSYPNSTNHQTHQTPQIVASMSPGILPLPAASWPLDARNVAKAA